MKLNHLNLTVANVAAATAFFETYFDFTCVDQKGDNLLAVLNGKDGFILTLMADAFNKNGSLNYPDAFHFGFILDSEEAVQTVFQKLKAGGMDLTKEPGKIRNSFGFYFHFQNLMIEVGYYFR